MDTAADIRLARLLQLTSPTLPVGAYAYSCGLEHAVAAGWVQDEATAEDWIVGVLGHGLAGLDLPILLRLHDAWEAGDEQGTRYWSAFLLACRESRELRAEDRQMGSALARLLTDLGLDAARSWRETGYCTWAAMFSLAARHWGIAPADMAQAYLWSWCENQVAAAVKLVPLGQTAGQRILLACGERIPQCLRHTAKLTDEDIGWGTPALALGSALHETQYSRLFRS